MPGTPSHVLAQGRQTAGPQPATILLFSTNIPPNGGGNTGFNTVPFNLTEKGIYQLDVDPWDTNNPGTVLFQSCATAGGTYTTETTMPASTVDVPVYYDLPQSKINFFFRFNTTAGAKALKVSMYDPFSDL